MSNPNYTAVLFIADVSGSMAQTYGHLQETLHLMLEQQARKLAGYLTVDVGYFDDIAFQGAVNADPMTVNLELFARGGTQIYDSSFILLKNFEDRLNKLPANEQPGHVVVVFITDGESTDARTAEGRNIGNYIGDLRQKRGWDFAFLGASSGSLRHVQGRLNLPANCGVFHPFNKAGIQKMADELGEFISMSRSGERAHF